MNLFNCYQGLAIWAATPFGLQWLYMHNNQLIAFMIALFWLWGGALIGMSINESLK